MYRWNSLSICQCESIFGEMVQLTLAKEEDSGCRGWLVLCSHEPQLFCDLSHSPVDLSTTSLGQGSQENRGNACRRVYTQHWGYVYVDLERFVVLWLASVNLYYHHVAFQRNG